MASSYPPQSFTILGISLDSVSGSIARGMPYLQLLLLRKVQEKFSFMMVEEITSHCISLTNSIHHSLPFSCFLQVARASARGNNHLQAKLPKKTSQINKKDLLYSTGNSAQCYGSLDGRGVWGRMDACICVAETLPRTRNYHNIVNWLYPNTK